MELDLIGVVEYFITHISCEDAGHGMVRAICGTMRNGKLVPAYSCIMPAVMALKCSPVFRDKALEVVGMDASTMSAH